MKTKFCTEIEFYIKFHFVEQSLPFTPQNLADFILETWDPFKDPTFIEDALDVCLELGIDANFCSSLNKGHLGFNFSDKDINIIRCKSRQDDIAHTIFHELYEVFRRSYNNHSITKVQENEIDADVFAGILMKE